MKLVDMTIENFSDILASDAPAPGGGSAAALNGAMGAALAAMVCALTVGRKKYAEFEAGAIAAQTEANDLRKRFLVAIDRDTEAFQGVSAVFSMPKDTDEQKEQRRQAMQTALKESTEPPLEVIELCAETLVVVERLMGASNASAVSDLGVAALDIKAAAQSAWLNVLINVGSIKDEQFNEKCRSKGQSLLQQIGEKADAIYEDVVRQLV